MKVSTRALRRVGVVALLTLAFLVIHQGTEARVATAAVAFCDSCSDCCAADRDACNQDVDSIHFACGQGALSNLDMCYGDVDAEYQDCQSWCPYDYYFGYWNTLQDCYNSCTTGANDGDRACVSQYNSEIGSCDSDQQSGHRDCSDNYDYCVNRCG